MSMETARKLYKSGEAHALSSALLYRAAVDHGTKINKPNPEYFAFNGICSLSIFYLIGLGFELYLKSAYAHYGGQADDKHLRNKIGHDLVKALNKAEARGFASQAPNLRQIVELLREPHLAHYFRYDRPEQIPLPEPVQIFETLKVLDEELKALLGL